MSIFYCEGCCAQRDADYYGCYEYNGEIYCDICLEGKPFCAECNQIETDPACIDTETCSQCGGNL